MAIASSLDASVGARVAGWLAPGLLAFPAASIGWFLVGDLRLDLGVAAVAWVLAGWRGCVGAMIGAARADHVFQANKVVAIELGISERTVEIHRAQVMKKMAARTLAQLVRMKIDLERSTSQTT